MLDWYATLIRLRHEIPELADADLSKVEVTVVDDDTVILHRGSVAVLASKADGPVEVDLTDADGEGPRRLEILASWTPTKVDKAAVAFQGPGAVVVKRSPGLSRRVRSGA
ncbi:MAG: DUF3459 domain-containing protein [Acidipropionibacterium sp.]|nr:DUF3459 domain-containing protein [Acidipropionibacterium sp.]